MDLLFFAREDPGGFLEYQLSIFREKSDGRIILIFVTEISRFYVIPAHNALQCLAFHSTFLGSCSHIAIVLGENM